MREITQVIWGCCCTVAMVISFYIAIAALDVHAYHLAMPWGICGLLWFANIARTLYFKEEQ